MQKYAAFAAAILIGAALPAQSPEAEADSPERTLHPIIVSEPDPNPTVLTGLWSDWIPPVQIECRVCHRVTAEEPLPQGTEDLLNFHTEISLDHGDLSCGACHDSNDLGELALAGGEEIGFAESMRLCAQCHIEEKADYDAGLHGGTTGHWDLTRGPQFRQHCIDCHDSHAPAPTVRTPVPILRGRLVSGEAEVNGDE